MNTQFRFARFVFALALAVSALGFSTSAALADKPEKTEITDTANYVLTDVCTFSVNIDSAVSITAIHYFDKSGLLTRIYNHINEQDTFTANGKTLIGTPFTYNIEALFDSDGNLTSLNADGVTEKIPLPDGSLFISAGQVDYLAHPDAPFILSPDKGNPGNLAGFCAALSQ